MPTAIPRVVLGHLSLALYEAHFRGRMNLPATPATQDAIGALRNALADPSTATDVLIERTAAAADAMIAAGAAMGAAHEVRQAMADVREGNFTCLVLPDDDGGKAALATLKGVIGHQRTLWRQCQTGPSSHDRGTLMVIPGASATLRAAIADQPDIVHAVLRAPDHLELVSDNLLPALQAAVRPTRLLSAMMDEGVDGNEKATASREIRDRLAARRLQAEPVVAPSTHPSPLPRP